MPLASLASLLSPVGCDGEGGSQSWDSPDSQVIKCQGYSVGEG